jgi:hypothetical protein
VSCHIATTREWPHCPASFGRADISRFAPHLLPAPALSAKCMHIYIYIYYVLVSQGFYRLVWHPHSHAEQNISRTYIAKVLLELAHWHWFRIATSLCHCCVIYRDRLLARLWSSSLGCPLRLFVHSTKS